LINCSAVVKNKYALSLFVSEKKRL
jgi:hypothetical protein